MKILCFSDLHCHNYAQHSRRLPNGLNSRFVDCLKIVDQVIRVVKERKISMVVFLGDLFESRTTISVDVSSETFKAMRKLADAAHLYMLVGNHDQWSRVGDVLAIEPFHEICQVVDEPWREVSHARSFYFIPYMADASCVKELLSDVGGHDIIFMHQTFAEAIAGPVDHKIESSLSLKDVPWDRIKLLVSGDIHKRQFHVGRRMHYVGSPLQLNFGERGEAKAFSVLDTETWAVEEVPTEAPRFFWPRAEDAFPDISSDCRMDRDFVRLSYAAKWTEQAKALKEAHPRVELDLLKPSRQSTQRIVAEDLQQFGDVHLLAEWLRIADLEDHLDPRHCLTIGLEELAEVSL